MSVVPGSVIAEYGTCGWSAVMTSSRPADAAAGPARPLPTRLQLESWRLLWEELVRDPESRAELRAWIERRSRVRPELLELLERFLTGAVDVEQLRATFDRRTRTDWDAFGLKGMSGAMFLNMLVKYVTDPRALAAQLRTALALPSSVDDGRSRLSAFADYLRALSRRGGAQPRALQPARASFFVTAWWHLQDTEQWPGFQLSARRALQLEQGLYTPSGDPVDDYFAFRDAARALAAALTLTTWELEYLCWWHHRHEGVAEPEADFYEPGRLRAPRAVHERPTKLPVVREPRAAPARRSERVAVEHTHIQWLLARIGKRLGCRIWIAQNDHRRQWKGDALGGLSIDRLPPLGLDPDSQRLVALIDVVWLKGANQVVAAFEVEHTTSIYSGMLRMADLAALSPNLNFPLYIVAPKERLEKVRRELLRPTFQMLELHRRCAFFSSEELLESAESIMRWGSGPAVIERLARLAESGPAATP
jgi:hypothetical protein